MWVSKHDQASPSPLIRRVLDALERAGSQPRRAGRGWSARCPAHEDRTPSLSLGVGRDGRVLVRCWAGCDTRTVLGVLGVGWSGLFATPPESSRRPSAGAATIRKLTPPAAPEPRRPPLGEVLDVWTHCRPLCDDAEAAAWARARGLDPTAIADRDLARALPSERRTPGWARIRGATWGVSGYRIVLPLFAPTGALMSLHARNVSPTSEPKGAFPAGHAVSGLVMADDAGRKLLVAGELPGTLWIVEGAPDFLIGATEWGDAADPWPAILGVVSGSWTPAIAARVPEGATVVVAVDHDEAGERYAARIAETLRGHVELRRWFASAEARV